MYEIVIDDKEIRRLRDEFPKEADRAAEIALDKTVVAIRDHIRGEMPKVFDRPTPYTLNSIMYRKTQGHNFEASVELKKPDRMGQHYLTPQVLGGVRPTKGYERALSDSSVFSAATKWKGPYHIPTREAKLDAYGNLPYGYVIQILSVLKKAEYISGYTANISEESKRRNKKSRDYVMLKTRHGKLLPGVYQRYQTGPGPGAKSKKKLPFGEWQRGKKKEFIRARGLKRILTRVDSVSYRPRLAFYEMAKQVTDQRLNQFFMEELDRRLK